MPPFIRYWLPVIVYCAFIFALSSFPSPDTLPRIPYSDKVMHVMAYALLGALVCRALNNVQRWRHRWTLLVLMAGAAGTVYGMSDEWHQAFVPGRMAELADLAADTVGSVAGSWICVRMIYTRLKSTITPTEGH